MEKNLVLIRHGESEWNLKNLFTGWKDPDLTEKGRDEAKAAAELLNEENIKFDVAFTSALRRAMHTCEIILQTMRLQHIPVISNQALNERDYGDLSGMNKDEARQKWGEEQVQIWRRSYDVRPPSGESLQDTAARVLPYYSTNIIPYLEKDHNVLIVAHGNSLRSLIMKLEDLSKDEIVKYELTTGVPIIYKLNNNNKLIKKKLI